MLAQADLATFDVECFRSRFHLSWLLKKQNPGISVLPFKDDSILKYLELSWTGTSFIFLNKQCQGS